ncbi:MAG: phosphoserine phosphatase SerB [Acidobacteriota bacterium]
MHGNVLTLVCEQSPDTAVVDSAAARLRSLGAQVDPPVWLEPTVACDLFFTGAEPDLAEARVRQDLEGRCIDLAAQPVTGRRKRLLIADMESTLIRNEMLDELADFAGVRSRVEDITARAMAGELDFAGALRERVARLSGLPETVLGEAEERIEVDPGASALVKTMSAHGAYTALVSGGFGVFAAPIAERLGFDHWRANTLCVEGGQLTGEVGEPILGRDAKQKALAELCHELGIEPESTAAVGDGANDLAMIAAAGLGVAYHGKPAVFAAARFSVRHGDLSTLLFYQGYRQAEFAG